SAAAPGPAATMRPSLRRARTARQNGVATIFARPPSPVSRHLAVFAARQYLAVDATVQQAACASKLLLRHTDDEAVEGVRPLVLAVKAARGAHDERELPPVL